MKEIIEKYKEITVHVGLAGTYSKKYNIVKALKKSGCPECIKLADELSVLEKQLEGKEWYEKIYIKSEKDLPKKEGLYFVNFKGGWMDTEYYRKTGGIVDWMDEFDWYLKPIK